MNNRSWRIRLVVLALISAVVIGTHSVSAAQAQARQADVVDRVRTALLRLPYYGVFDFLAFRYDKGTVALEGFAYRGSLPDDAARAARRVAGVDTIENRIETLPVSINDDQIRWATFYSIYTDSFLSRYAPGGGLSLRYDRTFELRRYPGAQPFGVYPIHIIVRNGRTILIGVVDTQADKDVAAMRAREVPGVFGVENELVVSR